MLFWLFESQGKRHGANEDIKHIGEDSASEANIDRGGLMQKAKTYLKYIVIKNEANFIDKVCRFLFPCCYVIFNLFYWPYFELASFGLHPPE